MEGCFSRSIVKCMEDHSGNKQPWIKHPLCKVPCVRLLGLWHFWFNKGMSDVSCKNGRICFEMGERKQGPFPVCLYSLTNFSLRIGFSSVFISSGYAPSWHTNSMCEWCGS